MIQSNCTCARERHDHPNRISSQIIPKAHAIRAVEEIFPRAVRGRCRAHRMRNLQNKVSEADGQELQV